MGLCSLCLAPLSLCSAYTRGGNFNILKNRLKFKFLVFNALAINDRCTFYLSLLFPNVTSRYSVSLFEYVKNKS